MDTFLLLQLILLWAQNEIYCYAAAFPTLSPSGPVIIKNGGSLALTCGVDQDAASVLWRRNGLTFLRITNTTLCTILKSNSLDTYNYTMTCDQKRTFSMVKYGVNNSDDSTTWSCQVYSLNNYNDLGTSLGVNVWMYVPVGSVQLKNGTSLTVIENQTAVLVCETAACRPSAAIYWMKDIINITDASTRVDEISVDSHLIVSIGSLFYTGKRVDNGKILTCGAYNGQDSVQISGNLTLTIYYPPKDPPVIEGQANGSVFTVIENTSQTLTCRITGGYPLASLSWICLDHFGVLSTSGETVSSEIVLTVSRSAQGKRCTCRSSHQAYGNRDAYVTLQINYPPSIQGLNSSYKVIENQPLNVTCDVNSNPPADQIYWSPSGESSVSKILYFSSVSRNKSGTYNCTAQNTMRPTSGTQQIGKITSQMQVDVLYPPSIEPHTSPYIVIENQNLSVSCVVSSNPPAKIYWSPSGESSVSSILYFSSVSRNNSGIYNCTAQNTMIPTVGTQQNGIAISQIEVDVQYGVEIVNLSVHGGNMVNENSSAILKCQVDSNPTSTITWMNESSSSILKNESGVVQSQYTIESAKCLDMGNYTCSAYNGIWTAAKERLELFVRCHPRTDFRLTLETKIYRKLHEAAVLRYTVIAYPPPKFSWTFLGNGNESRVLPVSASQHDNGQQSELRFTSLNLTDFGTYSVIADNSLFALAREVFEIIQADLPEVPSNVMLSEITQTSVKVQWMAGYNGGPQQTFHIVASAGDMTRIVNATDPGYQQNGIAVLEGLLPGTKYSIYVVAINSVGSSNMTEAINVTTLEDGTYSGNNSQLPAVVGGIGAGVAVILVVAVVVFLWRRYQHHKQYTDGPKHNKTERLRPESGLVDNPVYDSSRSVPDPSVNVGDEYAEVDKAKKKASNMDEPSNVYAQVNKTKKNLRNGKGKHGQISRGDIYENVDLVGKQSKPDSLYQNSSNGKAEPCDENLYEDARVTSANGPLKNKDGLLYADLMLDPPSKRNGKDIIRGTENQIEYAGIDYGKKGEPLPESDH